MQVAVLRIFRKVHRLMGAVLFIFFFVVAITGVLLGWKKNTNGWLLPATSKGTSTNLAVWKPIATLHTIADSVLLKRFDNSLATDLDRIDIRKIRVLLSLYMLNIIGRFSLMEPQVMCYRLTCANQILLKTYMTLPI